MATFRQYNYPSTIVEAACLLDDAMPGWEKKVDTLNLEMRSAGLCILGQLFEGYYKGMNFLFPTTVGRNADAIFGINASSHEWIAEINKRLSPPKKKAKIPPVVLELEEKVPDEAIVDFLGKILLSRFGAKTKLQKISQIMSEWEAGTLNQ